MDGEETEAPAESSETPNIDDIAEMFEGIDYTALLERYDWPESFCALLLLPLQGLSVLWD